MATRTLRDYPRMATFVAGALMTHSIGNIDRSFAEAHKMEVQEDIAEAIEKELKKVPWLTLWEAGTKSDDASANEECIPLSLYQWVADHIN